MIRRKILAAATLLAALASPVLSAAAESSPWSVRLRATYLETVDQSSGALGKDAIAVSDKLIPEFDIDYRLSADWSLELVLTIPQEHEVKLNGAKIGDFEHLPPTLLLQYHPQISEWFRPYVGAGVNLTLIMDDDLLGGLAKLDNYSVGPAGQVGFDVVLAEHWALNFDLKRAMIRSDVKVGGVEVAEARLDPWLYSLGLTYNF